MPTASAPWGVGRLAVMTGGAIPRRGIPEGAPKRLKTPRLAPNITQKKLFYQQNNHQDKAFDVGRFFRKSLNIQANYCDGFFFFICLNYLEHVAV